MKPISFLGNSLECLREFPIEARQDAGFQLDRVQRGEPAHDFKPMPAVGKGVEEIRVRDEAGTFRVIYTARLADAVLSTPRFPEEHTDHIQTRHRSRESAIRRIAPR